MNWTGEGQGIANFYVAQTLLSCEDQCLPWRARCTRACSAVEEGGAKRRRIHRSEGCCPRRLRKVPDLLVSMSRQDISCSEKGHLPKQQRVRNGESM